MTLDWQYIQSHIIIITSINIKYIPSWTNEVFQSLELLIFKIFINPRISKCFLSQTLDIKYLLEGPNEISSSYFNNLDIIISMISVTFSFILIDFIQKMFINFNLTLF